MSAIEKAKAKLAHKIMILKEKADDVNSAFREWEKVNIEVIKAKSELAGLQWTTVNPHFHAHI